MKLTYLLQASSLKMKMKACKTDPPLGALIVGEMAKKFTKVDVQWGKENSLDVGDDVVLVNPASMIRYEL